jgi:hypothetical protein
MVQLSRINPSCSLRRLLDGCRGDVWGRRMVLFGGGRGFHPALIVFSEAGSLVRFPHPRQRAVLFHSIVLRHCSSLSFSACFFFIFASRYFFPSIFLQFYSDDRFPSFFLLLTLFFFFFSLHVV